MATVLALAVLALGAKVEAETPFNFGPWEYYSFKPTVTAECAKAPVTVRLYLPLPRKTPAQELIRIEQRFSGGPVAEVFDRGKLNCLARYNLELAPDKPVQIGYDAVVATRSVAVDWDKVSSPPRYLRSEQQLRFSQFLRRTASTGRDHSALREAARAAADGQTDPVAVARRMYDLTLTHLRYERKLEFKGAGRAWDEGLGECGDYVAVFVALCRSVGVPARAVAGFMFRERRWQHHIWAEFYIHGVGWAPCDPSFGDTSPQPARHFGRIDSRRFAVTRDFDLSFENKKNLKTSVLQEYLFEYQGSDPPTISWHIDGEALGDRAPGKDTK